MNTVFKEFKGKTLYKIEGLEKDSYSVKFYCTDGSIFHMYPDDDTFRYGNDCSCMITDICGDITDLLDSTILIAEEKSNRKRNKYGNEKVWTFYTFATKKGYVDIRWYGEHNGYYSADVLFYKEETE